MDYTVNLNATTVVHIISLYLVLFMVKVSKVVGPDVYFMGIIDFQQEWTVTKRVGTQHYRLTS